MTAFIITVVVAVFLFIAKFLLFDYSYVPAKTSFAIDLEVLRASSGTGPELPTSVNCLFTGRGELVRGTVVAGNRTAPCHYVQTSFQIVYEDKTVIIDTPMGEEQFEQFRYGREFLKSNYSVMQEALRHASLILFTHEHSDHIGGLAASPSLSETLLDRVILTREQVDSRHLRQAGLRPERFMKRRPLEYDGWYRVAPGIILIKAPGHTPGHQMIFVKLKNGDEFVFSGDAVWNFANIKEERARPILVNLIGGENPWQVGKQIRWLCDVYLNRDKQTHIVPNHDVEILNGYIRRGLFGDSFFLPRGAGEETASRLG